MPIATKRLRVNELVLSHTDQVRLINESSEQVGIVDSAEALALARTAGMDLVEVAPTSAPPVCRIMDFGKWMYDQKKREHKSRVKQHHVVLKEVRLRPGIEEHDREFKLKKAREFLTKGNKVQFTMLFRGRQMAHLDMAMELMRELAATLEDVGKIETHPSRQGRRMTMLLCPQGPA